VDNSAHTTSLLLISSLAPAGAAVINLTAPSARTDDPVTNQTDWTLDAGYFVSGSDAVIFEAGGDGTGTALVVVGTTLHVYQDLGDFNTPSPTDDTSFSLDISAFAGSAISIRLDADLTTASDSLTLTATNGTATVSNSAILPVDVVSIAGGNDTGFGLTAPGDIAGLDESAIFAPFNDASYKPGGANVLGPDFLEGTLYVNEAAPDPIPAPSSWGVIPEPGSSTLILLAGLLGGVTRRR
jgi:hypothetical protein